MLLSILGKANINIATSAYLTLYLTWLWSIYFALNDGEGSLIIPVIRIGGGYYDHFMRSFDLLS